VNIVDAELNVDVGNMWQSLNISTMPRPSADTAS